MNWVMAAVLLAMGAMLGSGQALAQPGAEQFRTVAEVDGVLRSLSAALPARGGWLRANVVPSSQYAVRVLNETVIVSTAFLREASRNALAAGIAYQLLPDPVYFAITMDRAGFDGPNGLAELGERLLYDIAMETHYRAAVDAAYEEMTQAIFQDNFWVFVWPGDDLMYGRMMGPASVRYVQALAAYEAYRAARPDLPPITAEFVRMVTEVTTVLRSGRAGVSSWRPQIDEALKAYQPQREE